jgi:hypothetical protein
MQRSICPVRTPTWTMVTLPSSPDFLRIRKSCPFRDYAQHDMSILLDITAVQISRNRSRGLKKIGAFCGFRIGSGVEVGLSAVQVS